MKDSGEWREKYTIERRMSEREREKEAANIRCKKWKVKDSGECVAGGPWTR